MNVARIFSFGKSAAQLLVGVLFLIPLVINLNLIIHSTFGMLTAISLKLILAAVGFYMVGKVIEPWIAKQAFLSHKQRL